VVSQVGYYVINNKPSFRQGQFQTFCVSNFCLSSFSSFIVIAEPQRARRASEAPWVRKIGNPSSRENLVMTSA